MIAVGLVYLGLVAACIGVLGVVHPIRRIGLTTRVRGAIAFAIGVMLVGVGFTLPADAVRVAPARTRLDELMPAYQFNEVHTVRIAAAPERVYRAVREVTAGEIALFQLLTWIRRLGRPGPESILAAPDRVPIIDVATRTTFLLLADEPPRELVVGTVVLAPANWRRSRAPTAEALVALQRRPGFAVAAMNFRLEPDGAGLTRLSTETRVFATDAESRRRFARYWRIIYPGSAIIRRSWLRAVRRRAEGGS